MEHSALHVALTWNQVVTRIAAESTSAPSARADTCADTRADAAGSPALSEGIEVMCCGQRRGCNRLLIYTSGDTQNRPVGDT